MIKAFLEAQEIPVTLNQESVGRTFGLSAGRLGEVQILVPETQSDEAEKILKALFEGKYELGDETEENKTQGDETSVT